MGQLHDALAEDCILLDDLRQVIAHLQALEGVHHRRVHGLGGQFSGAHIVQVLGKVLEKPREFVDQHRPVEVPRGPQPAHLGQPVGKDPLAMRTEEVG